VLCTHARAKPPTALPTQAQASSARRDPLLLNIAAGALNALRRHREALILLDEALEAVEGRAEAVERKEDVTAERLGLLTEKMKTLRHLGRLEEATDVGVKALSLMRPNTPACSAASFLREAAMLNEASGMFDLALDFDAKRSTYEKSYKYDPDVVRRWAIHRVADGRHSGATDTLRECVSVLDGEAQTSNARLFTAEGKLQIHSERRQGTLKLLQLLKDLLRASEGGEDGTLPRHVADETRQVGPATRTHATHEPAAAST
jgi:tetratricopeptide (TPR) repeat protein